VKKLASPACLLLGIFFLLKTFEADGTVDNISLLFFLTIATLFFYWAALLRKTLPKSPACPECGRPGQRIYSMVDVSPKGYCSECDLDYPIKPGYHYDNNKLIRIAAILAIVFLSYGGWYYYNLSKIQSSVEKKAKVHVRPIIAPAHVRDIGYIEYKRVKIDLARREKLIQWQVKVPRTNVSYWCTWECGFTDFEKGEGVLIIHLSESSDLDEWGGYIIGLHGHKRGKVAKVWAVDTQVLIDIEASMY